MPEYLDDPSVLTKDKLKSELLAHNVELPSGNPNKDVYVQLYLKELTSQNGRPVPATLDAFSSDEELPPPVLSGRNRSSGTKSSRRGEEKGLLGELDVSMLSDQGLREELLRHGLEAGPIVASTRKVYEKKLQKLLDNDPPPSEVTLADTKVISNGTSDPELYSDQDDDVTEVQPEPVMVPEPVPVVERPLRSHGRGPLTDLNIQHTAVEKITASEQSVRLEELPSVPSSPTGISVTCRRPIRGAAGRPVRSSQLFSANTSTAEARITHRLTSLPRPPTLSSSCSSSSSRPMLAALPAGQTTAVGRAAFPWMKLLLLAVLAALLFFVYQTMEPTSSSPFNVADVGGASE